jgi:multidrug efflux pump subunit AcrA (membrane-fusion protein)
MKFVYLDKKDRIHAWFTAQRKLATAGAMLLILLLPMGHESIKGRFVLEPKNRAILRALVPGTVTEIHAHEGQSVTAGSLLVQLRNLPLQSQLARASADAELAGARATSALLRYADFGAAVQERDRLYQQKWNLSVATNGLSLRSPISGVVVTPRVADRLGSYVVAGTELVEIADVDTLRARIYVSEHDLYKLRASASARLMIDGSFKVSRAQTSSIAPLPASIAPGLLDLSRYAGMRAPNFYVVDLLVPNPQYELRPGMIGTARIYGPRQSLAGLMAREMTNFFGRKIW